MLRSRENRSPIQEIAVLSVLLAVSAVASRGEVEYLFRGGRTTATIDSAVEKLKGDRLQRNRARVKDVQFHFVDSDGTNRTGRDEVATEGIRP